MQYNFTSDYLTGIESVDAEHRKLFEIANRAYALLTDDFREDKYDQILAIMEELRDYTKTHFAHDEAYMESIQYKRRFSQKLQQRFLKRQHPEPP